MPSGWATIAEHDRWGNNWYGLWKSANGNKFHFRWSSDANGRADFQQTIAINTWYHVVGTYSNGTARLYLNGTLDSVSTAGSAPTSNDNAFRIGQNMDGGEGFPGLIHDLKVYDGVLSDSQVSALFAQGL
jgi:hypothetical protein